MARPSYVVDQSRLASKIRNAAGASDSLKNKWKSNPTKSCPNCQSLVDNSDVDDEWPGLPRGVKFDPSDEDMIWHLFTKVDPNSKPHPYIDEFIPTINEEYGICYTHPQNLPGTNQDGSMSHFFHQATRAFNTGKRTRRKVQHNGLGDISWHVTGKTKPVLVNGSVMGFKKIMVLYESPAKGEKTEKTNWVMHQYHLRAGEDEKEDGLLISKVFYQHEHIFYQHEQIKSREKNDELVHTLNPEPAFTEQSVEDEANRICENGSPYVVSTQELAEHISDLYDILHSQSPNTLDYANLRPEQLKMDLEMCENPEDVLGDIDIDTPPDFRLSQLEFGSQEVFIDFDGSIEEGNGIN